LRKRWYGQTLIECPRVWRYIFYATMSRTTVHEASLLVAFGVLFLFLFPASAGPYPAVHGPATALQAAQSSTQLQLAMAAAPRTFIGTLFRHMVASPAMQTWDSDVALLASSFTSVLRC